MNIKTLLATACGVAFALSSVAQEANPVANPDAVVTSGNARFTVLTPEMIRLEYSEKKQFEDRASFVVINRYFADVPQFTVDSTGNEVVIKTDALELRYKKGTPFYNDDRCNPNLSITMQLNGESIQWYPGKVDPYNLKGTTRTLDQAEGDVRDWLEDGLVSRSGWAVIDEKAPRRDGSYSLMFDGKAATNGLGFDWVEPRKDPEGLDMYFMGYGHDYKKALYDFTRVAGKMPLPPLFMFGYWYSKYQRYSEQDFKDIVNEIKSRDIPMDVLVVDMDWHRNGKTGSTANTEWTGWSWNKELIPDPAEFIDWIHSEDLHTTLNLHPADGVFPKEDNYQALWDDLATRYSDIKADSLSNADGTIRWNIENPDFYEAFFQHILRPHEALGVDFWWLDWQQWMIAQNFPDLGNTFWLNHVFFNDMKQNRTDRRPIIFHRWGGLGNHRYPIGFSGDSEVTFGSLAFQPYFTATASNVGYGYWSHDIGGHNQAGDNDPELYLRWIQYGVFSPFLRTHATSASHIERRIWMFPNFEQMRDAICLRYTLVPYIYTMARQSYDTGVGICRPMYYEYPELEEAYLYEGQYMFGDDILAAPITATDNGTNVSTKEIWFPEGTWYEVMTGEVVPGGQVATRTFEGRELIPYYYREGAIVPLNPDGMTSLMERPGTLTLQFAPGAEGSFSYYEDEGNSSDYATAYTTTEITQRTADGVTTCVINPREGQFEGMPTERAYRLELLARDETPASVTLNGTAVDAEYDAEGHKVIVNVPATACSETITVVVK